MEIRYILKDTGRLLYFRKINIGPDNPATGYG
jgi:hypothetical protein